MFEYKPTGKEPPRLVYLKTQVSLKGLPPGDYDLTIILHDEIDKGAVVTKVLPFRIIPVKDPRKTDLLTELAADQPKAEKTAQHDD